ncbi:hypothetical protein VTL71DRAFT_10386 [Oculimacula yallundae]|uniref:Uncharacterized protein n=1 Tax=Oculimacula yallundae TaxID=86028 RepID=A0ABR4CTE3_9HELO
MHLPFLATAAAILSLASTANAWHCAKNKHTKYFPACCDEVDPSTKVKFPAEDCYQPFPVTNGNETVKHEYTCVSDGTTFGFPGCCKVEDREKNMYTCKPVVD